ncbi:MAG: hypothetical protein HZC54_05005 [Verrucomicrobia bacterium]|nr:hypothetical protein [Verrucomicrobiota bacterium]
MKKMQRNGKKKTLMALAKEVRRARFGLKTAPKCDVSENLKKNDFGC